MRKEEIVGLAVRIFALYVVISTLGNLGRLIEFSKMGSTQDLSLTFLVPAISVPLLVALSLWLLPLTVARKLLPTAAATPENEAQATPAEYQVAAFSILGMWALAQYLPTVFFWLGYAFYLNAHPEQSLSPNDYGRIFSTVGGIVIGFWLLFGARGLVGILRYARTAGSS